jgi:hypothetical protein
MHSDRNKANSQWYDYEGVLPDFNCKNIEGKTALSGVKNTRGAELGVQKHI